MMAIGDLQECLQREMPRCRWVCRVLPPSERPSAGDDDEFEVSAFLNERLLAGCPMRLNAGVVTRWGMEVTARFICRELSVTSHGADGTSAWEWDKLAEL